MFFLRILSFIFFVALSVAKLNSQAAEFIPNQGQWYGNFEAKAEFYGGAFFIQKNGCKIVLHHPEDLPKIHEAFHHRFEQKEVIVRSHAIELEYFSEFSAREIKAVFHQPFSHYYNFFYGSNAIRWKTNLHPYAKVEMQDYFKGISAVYTIDKNNNLEQDWIIDAGINPNQIGFRVKGASFISAEDGNLLIKTSVGNCILKKPIAYQIIGETKHFVPCNFQLIGNEVKYQLGNYNNHYPLIIDPILVFSTYSGSKGDNFGFTATYDSEGHLYAGGIVDTLNGAYPVTLGAFQTQYGGRGSGSAPINLPSDVTISKYKSDGAALIYATYLGGRDDEMPYSLVADNDDNLVILGATLSPNFPVDTLGYKRVHGGEYDIFVIKLSKDGSKMLGGTFMGGSSRDGINTGALQKNYADDFRGDIFVDGSDYVYVASCSRSSNFPIKNAIQSVKKSGLEGVVFSLSSDLRNLRWSTFLGGDADDAAYSIKVDGLSQLYVAGGTMSNNFPMPLGGFKPTFSGSEPDGWILQLEKDSCRLRKGSFYGTNQYDQIYFLDYDIDNKIYITGQTSGSINRSSGTYGQNNTTQFISRLSNDLSQEEKVTTFGNRTNGVPELSPSAFMVDNCYNVYFSGWGSDIGNPGTTENLQITPNAIQKTTDNQDFYLISLSKDFATVNMATYFGGNASGDHVDGGTSRFDKRGVVYQSVCASCPDRPPGLNDFPTTAGAAFTSNSSWRCSNASFKLDFNITYATFADFTYLPKNPCFPEQIQFINKSKNSVSYKWDFGDGNTSTEKDPKHNYTKPGKYTVTLEVTDPLSCNLKDKKVLVVELLEGAKAELLVTGNACTNEFELEVIGNDLKTPKWNLGDGTEKEGNKVKHLYKPGSFRVKVFIENTRSTCRDTLETTVNALGDSFAGIRLTNVFTPNGDGINDCFQVLGLNKECSKARLKIFNRWGEKLYESKDLSDCWNGKVNNNGSVVPEGTYFMHLEYEFKNTGKREVRGVVSLIRG